MDDDDVTHMITRCNETLDATVVGSLVHRFYRHKYACVGGSRPQWFVHDGLKWQYSELGILEVIGSAFVTMCERVSGKDTCNELRLKMKNMAFKESVCKICAVIFNDPDFFSKLDKDSRYICFRNGVYDTDHDILHPGSPLNISVWLDHDFEPDDIASMPDFIAHWHKAVKTQQQRLALRLRSGHTPSQRPQTPPPNQAT
jgi:hypothetical protein